MNNSVQILTDCIHPPFRFCAETAVFLLWHDFCYMDLQEIALKKMYALFCYQERKKRKKMKDLILFLKQEDDSMYLYYLDEASEDSRLKKSSMKKSPAKQENNRGKIGF